MSDRVISEKIYALLLRLYPRRFQNEYGAEMQRLFRDRLAAEQGIARVQLWLDVLADLAVSVPREYRRPTDGFRVSPRAESIKGSIKMVLGFGLMGEVALWGGASRAWVTGVLLLSLVWAFLVLVHGWKTPAWEYSLDDEGIGIRGGLAKAVQIRSAEIVRIVQFQNDLIVFGSNGSQIPIYSFASGYSVMRDQLAAWAPIEVLHANRIPDGILALAYVATLLMTNRRAVILLAFVVGLGIVYITMRPDQHPQMPVGRASRAVWIVPAIALAVLATKVCITLSSL